jgi:hypothetical protein
MAILSELFATKIVANNFFGFDNSFWTMINFFEGDFSPFPSKSVKVNEKNATSAPDIKAEHNNKTSKTTILDK